MAPLFSTTGEEYSELRRAITERPFEKLAYLPNRGNAGDSLIVEASYQFLETFSGKYEILDFTATGLQESTVVIGGGGNLVKPYPNIATFLRERIDSIGHVIIMPHSIRDYIDLLGQFRGRIQIFCREEPSYKYVRGLFSEQEAFLGHDMALCWDEGKARDEVWRNMMLNFRDSTYLIRNLKHLVRMLRPKSPFGSDMLSALRLDIESPGGEFPKGNIDVSRIFSTDSTSRPYSAAASLAMLRFMQRYKIIRSNRLHVSILAAMSGLKVEMLDNNYGKNKDIYERSIKGRMPNVVFMG